MMKSMDKDPKAKKKSASGVSKAAKKAVPMGKISKSDYKTMPRNEQGVITYDTIKKTRVAKGKKAAPKKKSYPKLMMKSSSRPM
jgi:hypothetical protein